MLEQTELRDSARDLLAGLAPSDAFAAIRDAGWLSLTAPEAAGGLEQPFEAACWLYRELGFALSPAPLLPALLAVEALAACTASAGRDDWIARTAAGEGPAVSLLDPLRANDTALAAVQGIGRTSHVLVVTPLLVALAPIEHVSVTPRVTWDKTRDLADVVLNGAPLTILAEGEAARNAATAASVHLHFALAADSVGAADAILGRTVDYLQMRRQFDRPLALFQALKHRCADLKTAIAAAEALLADYLKAADRGDALAIARAAKALCSATFRDVAEDALQLHGGIGMTEEHPCHFYLKRALLNEHLGSANDACDVAMAEDLLAG